MAEDSNNKLFFGDNLALLRRFIEDEMVDLIYLDPPFNSKQAYDVILEQQNGSGSRARIEAFDDTWHWTSETARLYEETVEEGGSVASSLKSFRDMLGPTDMMAYLANMAPRLVELHRVLKPTGSIYLHCDATASHYLKVLMDAIFGAERFQREIIWRIGWVSGFKTQAHNWIRNHDVILYYTKSEEFTFNKLLIPYREGYTRRDGSKPTGKGIPIEDTWNCHPEDRSPSGEPLDSIMIKSFSKEKLGYPTQKPEALVERIIEASSNEGDLVLDPFCGCGTTVVVAHRCHRRWIGIDRTHIAVNLMKYRLRDTFGEEVREAYEVIGEPPDLAGAHALAELDRHQFELWALGLVGARPHEKKKGPDKGIDGRLYFHGLTKNAPTEQIVISVKSGQVGVGDIRDLRGVVERENAAIGVLITLQQPTRPMKQQAAAAGFYTPPHTNEEKSPRMQILTVGELLDGARIDCRYVHTAPNTFKRARRHHQSHHEQNARLPLDE